MIVFLFDGTCNGRDDEFPTNIRLLHRAIPGSHYFEGPGNADNWLSKAFGGGLGVGMLRIVDTAYKSLCAVYRPHEKIHIFGFSRGAAIARKFASKIVKDGVNGHAPDIEFIGCFDTVFARVPLGYFQQNSLFGDLHVSPKVKRAAHAVSIDEDRKAFTPNLMNAREGINEVWFRGCHADVGGGYEERGLADYALHWMVEQSGLKVDLIKLPAIGDNPIVEHSESGFWRREPRRIGVKRDDEWTEQPAIRFIYQ